MHHMNWYAPDRETRIFTCTCGWSGRLADMSDGEWSWDFAEHECPDCFKSLVIRERPFPAEVRAAASRAIPRPSETCLGPRHSKPVSSGPRRRS